MARRRGNGEGTIYQRSQDGRWSGVVTVKNRLDGRSRRKYVTAKSRAEVSKKLKSLQRQIDDGLPGQSVFQ
jgi:integrase